MIVYFELKFTVTSVSCYNNAKKRKDSKGKTVLSKIQLCIVEIVQGQVPFVKVLY